MLYISRFEFPDAETETDFRFGLKMTCYDSIYPFGVLSEKGLTQLDFEDITLLCGGNGTGKTTALNIIAEKLKLTRASLYNRSCFFERYLEDCSFICELEITPHSRIITSIAQAIVFVCESPKSNSIVLAVDGAFAEAEKTIDEPVPIHLRDTSYKGAKQLGHGAGYKYPHDYPNHEVEQKYMPPSVEGHVYYVPTDMGIESRIKQTHERKGRI